nr:putative ribonuclease H-like domain-containing protein [Tanacetum cinerariifolium]
MEKELLALNRSSRTRRIKEATLSLCFFQRFCGVPDGCQKCFSLWKDHDFPDKVYKVEKALYGLHQAPRAWYEILSTYLLDNGFHKGKIDKTLFIRRHTDDILLIKVYVDDIIFGSTKKELCNAFEKMMHEKFQMSSMGELTFFLGLQVKQNDGNDKVIMWYQEPRFGLEFCVVDLFDSFFGFNQRFVKSRKSGSESHPPMLNKENYVPWPSRLLRYAKSRPNGKLIHNSILNGPYVRKMIPEPGDANRDITVTKTFHLQTDDELSDKELKKIEANDQAIQTILLGLPEDIYAAVGSFETAQEIWLHTKDLHTVDYTKLYDFLKYNQKENAGNPAGYNDVIRNQVIQNAVQNPKVQNVGNQNGLIGVQENENQNQIGNGNLVVARAEGNAAGQNRTQI